MSNNEATINLDFVSTPTFGTLYLPQILSSFARTQQLATNLNFSWAMPEDIKESMRCGTFEIAVLECCSDFDLSEFKTVSLPDDKLVFAIAASVKLSSGRPQIEELLNYTLLSCPQNCCIRILLEKNLRSKGFTLRNFRQIIEFSDLKMLTQALVAGVGIAFLPEAIIGSVVDVDQLNIYQVADFIHHRKRSLILQRQGSYNPLAQKFGNRIVSYFEKNPVVSG